MVRFKEDHLKAKKNLTLTQARITQDRARDHANLWIPPYKALSVVEARRAESFWYGTRP